MAQSNKGTGLPLTESQRRKNELIAEMARARSGMSLHIGEASHQAEVGRRLKEGFNESFRRHFGSWLAGGLLTGGLISLLPAREKKVYVNPLSKDGKTKLAVQGKKQGGGGWFAAILRALVPIVKPVLTAFITKQLANIVGGAKEAQHSAERTADKAEEATQQAQDTAQAVS